jgi:hypothetical protein
VALPTRGAKQAVSLAGGEYRGEAEVDEVLIATWCAT